MPWFCSEKNLPKFYKKIQKYSKADVAFAAQYILENIVVKYIKSKISGKKKCKYLFGWWSICKCKIKSKNYGNR